MNPKEGQFFRGDPSLHLPFLILFLFMSFSAFSQEKATIKGVIKDEKGEPVSYANLKVKHSSIGTYTDESGRFGFKVPSDSSIELVISHTGFKRSTKTLRLAPGEVRRVDVVLTIKEMKGVVIKEERIKDRTMMKIPKRTVEQVPTASGDFVAQTLSSQPGVAINNELSSSYSVRGGNFDENLIYVNDVRIYRPFLVRAGRQEGLNFVNSDMVSSILFSAGGFESRYGDKMASVLDIQYKKPKVTGGSVSGSLLGGSAHIQGASEGYRFTGIAAFRYKSNSYLLNSLETQGQYKPNFTDAQTYLTYDVTEKLEIAFLGHYSRNRYNFIPQSRETNFGGINSPLRLSIDFRGAERDRFETFTGALTGTFKPNDDLRLKLITSSFGSDEEVNFDLKGVYRLDEINKNLGSDEFGEVIQNRGIGGYHEHARNEMISSVNSIQHRGILDKDQHVWEWGLTFQHERIEDQLEEWEKLDSAGYSLPHPTDSIGYTNPNLQPDHELQLQRTVFSQVSLQNERMMGYLQHTWSPELSDTSSLDLTLGVRGHYWTMNQQPLFSPRFNITYNPGWFTPNDSLNGDRIRFRFAAGYYYQPPFYREIRDMNGNIHPEVKAQRSIHFVLGGDYAFRAWDRPFTFTTEVYYKKFDDLNPYEIDNVRIRYYAHNRSHGYAKGVDLKLNGEFVSGLESWASVSIMETEEDLEDDFYFEYRNAEGERVFPGSGEQITDTVRKEPGYIPRPTDQLVNIGLFFQDEMPKWPSYKVHLKLIYASGLPFGPPTFERYKDTLRTPPYRRVDIGFSKDLLHKDSKLKNKPFFKHLDHLKLRLSVFNLLQIRNTVSYLWIEDITNRQYAVPNHLTGRLINFGVEAEF